MPMAKGMLQVRGAPELLRSHLPREGSVGHVSQDALTVFEGS